jgi:hypothetical protein
MTLSPDGRWCGEYGLGPRGKIWDVATGRHAEFTPGLDKAWTTTDWRFTPDGRVRVLSVRFPDQNVQTARKADHEVLYPLPLRVDEFDSATGAHTQTWEITAMTDISAGFLNEEDELALSPGGRFVAYGNGIALGTMGGTEVRFRMWELKSEGAVRLALDSKTAWPMEGGGGFGNPLLFSPDGSRVALRLYSELHIWQLETGQGPQVVRSRPWEQFRFSRDGQRLISLPAAGKPAGSVLPRRFKVWETELWQQVLDVPLPDLPPSERWARYGFDGKRLWQVSRQPKAVVVTVIDGSQTDTKAGQAHSETAP